MQTRLRSFLSALLLVQLILVLPVAAHANQAAETDESGNSAPVYQEQPQSFVIAPARDIAWPGSIRLQVDVRDTERAIFSVTETLDIPPEARKAGYITLLFPDWLPGNHAPRGETEKLAGLRFESRGKALQWKRDHHDMNAFHVMLKSSTSEITAHFQFLSPTGSGQERILVGPNIVHLRWNNVSLYPAGYYTRNIPVSASLRLPEGWRAASALRPNNQRSDMIEYQQVSYETLIDSPVMAGKYMRSWPLGHNVTLHAAADREVSLTPANGMIERYQQMVEEAFALFGQPQFDHYDFLLFLSSHISPIGIEHHRSSENAFGADFLGRSAGAANKLDLLPHELVHSWNGKYRMPAGIWRPDFRTPLDNHMLWAYEGLTQYWGYMLASRANLFSPDESLSQLAATIEMIKMRKGRSWRPLADTVYDPILAARAPLSWDSWQRSEDYYYEAMLIWLEADCMIRKGTRGRASLDDLAPRFFTGRPGDWGTRLYTEADLFAALDGIYSHDWEKFFHRRVEQTGGIDLDHMLQICGYRLDYQPDPGLYQDSLKRIYGLNDFSHSIGLEVYNSGRVSNVIWDSPAFRAGMTNNIRIIRVNEKSFSISTLQKALRDASRKPISLFYIKQGREYSVKLSPEENSGYPALKKTGKGTDWLAQILAPRSESSAAGAQGQ